MALLKIILILFSFCLSLILSAPDLCALEPEEVLVAANMNASESRGLALYYMEVKRDNEMAVKTLDMMDEKIPRKIVGMRYEIMSDLADLYKRAGDEEKFREIALEVEDIALKMIERRPTDFRREGNPYMILISLYESMNEYSKLVDLLKKLQVYLPNDPSIQNYIDRYTKLAQDSAEVTPQELDIEQN